MTLFSLVLGTTGSTDKLGHFLAALDAQTQRGFELIVVDQNRDERLAPILARYERRFPILCLKSRRTGVSTARNLGLEHSGGEIIGFPDDDCWYPPDLLSKVAEVLRKTPGLDGLTGRSVDEKGRNSNGRFDSQSGPVDRLNVWTRGIEYTVFLRAGSARGVRFDESLGVGAGTPWGAGEGTDYLLRLLERGVRLRYDPDLVVFHPPPVPPYDEKASLKARAYGRGMGRVLRRHGYPGWFVAKWLVRPLGGAALSLVALRFGQARYRLNVYRGRLRGLLARDNE